ncbi:MAG: aconitate hydratase 1 [Planctomycetes bacterium RBG_16_64_10]|nr:MAG: aconitate hydratase 1 [Planctomycetes bacterium RBG_16_64_10]
MVKTQSIIDPFAARDTFDTGSGRAVIWRLTRLEDQGLGSIGRLPFAIRILLESVLRNCDGFAVTQHDVRHLAAWGSSAAAVEIPFKPARVVLQDFTGVPAIVDLAAMRSAMHRLGGAPSAINPLIPADLVIDHSVQVDRSGSADALAWNVNQEFQRNEERYRLLRWAQTAFDNLRVIPPNIGIVHQVNLELLAEGVCLRTDAAGSVALPDSLVGTDSHTTMINGLGVLGWGVGGIEAEAALLGQPLYLLMPEVVGMELVGELPTGTTATDLVLTVTERLRAEGVVGKFVEFFGTGATGMPVAHRATVANMAPEYGATMGYFPIDAASIDYLRWTGRSAAQVELVERYCKEQALFRAAGAPMPDYTKTLRFDLATVEPSLAGPKRPQDRVPVAHVQRSFQQALRAPLNQRGFALDETTLARRAKLDSGLELGHGDVVIAAITSCTNTSNPSVMMAAGLLAKKAVENGLRVKPHVKTSLAPGSRVVTQYLKQAGLDRYLEAIGFFTVGYGCTTCIGNSGPLPDEIAAATAQENLVVAAVLSGNRNFEGRVNPLVKANYLASPPLVVAYALAGTVDIDLTSQPLGQANDGRAVYLKDLWPDAREVDEAIRTAVQPAMFRREYDDVWAKNPQWNAIETATGELYQWDASSTYIQEPPFLLNLAREPAPITPICGARVLVALGDSTTTDHISPAGVIARDSPAGRYLESLGVAPADFNSYGSRRGNDRVMTRGTFANVRIRNLLAPGTEGGVTRHLPDGESMTIYDAALRYQAEGVPLVVLAGTEYGTGSSRDWAAKGTQLLGVRAVLAASFERIHRSNLIGMGILPLEFPPPTTWQSLGLTGAESFDLPDLGDDLQPGATLSVRATGENGACKEFTVCVRIDTPVELQYYRHGGILPTVLRRLLAETMPARPASVT